MGGDAMPSTVSSPRPAQILAPRQPLVSWACLVGRGVPVEVDIGCGKGKLVLARAQLHPQRHFLGLDRAGRYMRIGVARAEKRGLRNVAFVKTDARLFIGLCLPPASVSIFHISFPDPWPKRRHHKRRLVTAEFLDLLHQRLIPRGRVELATDDVDYVEAMRDALARVRRSWHRVREGVNQSLVEDATKTNYELKYEAAGRTLYYLELVT